MRFHFDPYEIFKKTPPPPAKVAKPAKPGGKTGDFSNFSNFSKPIPGFLENPDPSPDDRERFDAVAGERAKREKPGFLILKVA